MKITEDQVIEFLSKLDWNERNEIDRRVFRKQSALRQEKYLKEKDRRERAKKKHEIEGEKFKKILRAGNIIKCRGTNDGKGIREVISMDAVQVTCRKLTGRRGVHNTWQGMKRDNYITEHKWDKIVEILADKFEDIENTPL